MSNDFKVTLSTGRIISLMRLRVKCDDANNCNIDALHKRYPNLTHEEDLEIKEIIKKMFEF